MTGELKAKAKDTRTGAVINFKLNWEAEQLPEGADAINPTSKDITFTLKYVSNEQPVVPPVNPTNPEKPKLPKTAVGTDIALYSLLVGIFWSSLLQLDLKEKNLINNC